MESIGKRKREFAGIRAIRDHTITSPKQFSRKFALYNTNDLQKTLSMKIHEHQGKDILKEFGVPVPVGFVAYSVDEAVEAARNLPTDIAVVKAQIHAGGRGKGGGVKLAKNLDEVREI